MAFSLSYAKKRKEGEKIMNMSLPGKYTPRRRASPQRLFLSFLTFGIAFLCLCGYSFLNSGSGDVSTGRHLLSGSGTYEGVCDEIWETRPTLEEPYWIFSFVIVLIIYFCIVMYTFLGLALICDSYFVASLDKISEALHLSEDVAGATFMAAGSSAPELFTSAIAVFGPENDIGVGTIVGSAVFNIFVIIGVTAIFAGKTLFLDWKPLMRDSLCYSGSVVILMITFIDNKVDWWESIVFVFGYAGYVILMAFNQDLTNIIEYVTAKIPFMKYLEAPQPKPLLEVDDDDEDMETLENKEELLKEAAFLYTPRNNLEEKSNGVETNGVEKLAEQPSVPEPESTEEEAVAEPEGDNQAQSQITLSPTDTPTQEGETNDVSVIVPNPEEVETEEEESEKICVFPLPDSWSGWIIWVIGLPYYVGFFLTVPDCSRPFWDRFYLVSFASSICWIAALSFLMVEFANKMGCMLDIDPSIMGMTFLAAGTSVPDALSSVLVAREGLGDMAVSNAIGSNVFDILLGLGLPWVFKTCIMVPGSAIQVKSDGLLLFVIILFLVLICVIFAIAASRWRLNWITGIFLIIGYFLFVIFSLAFAAVPRIVSFFPTIYVIGG